MHHNHQHLLSESHNAFWNERNALTPLIKCRVANLNGDIVSDSDDTDNEKYAEITDTKSEKVRSLIMKRRAIIRRKARYLKVKMIAERNFLSKKQSKRVKGILIECPNIGEVIENYVQESNIGADAWRRTGVLAFDGNTKVKSKVTFSRIREHLQSVYKRKFSHGTVVELCIARNKRRRSAERYKGVAHVTCRRARKGFQLKYNPDSHWSSAFYKALNLLQYKDGRHILNINRDDASGFRLDTMATHRLHKTPIVQGKEALTTYTDYVNRYPSTLQTTSYNFSGTQNTQEVCAGIVKASGLFPKNPAQHAADLAFLQTVPSLLPVFTNPIDGSPKVIECIRVDGGSDEGPSHEEVQFFWTARHLERPTVTTLITTHNSGASHLNRVELQNGCMSLAHANLFIPSTLSGSCLDSKTGKVDSDRFKRNMRLATEVYINRVNQCPCGEGNISLFEGADSTKFQELRSVVIKFLKGSKQQKAALKQSNPDTYSYVENVWNVRNSHMVSNYPTQYVFQLICCYQPTCIHHFCRTGNFKDLPKWFLGGPNVSYIPMPIPDPARQWGSINCPKCTGKCYGHFLEPNIAMLSPLKCLSKPPSSYIKEIVDKNDHLSDREIEDISKAVLLPPEEVEIWIQHLKTVKENRKQGAIRAAQTRKNKKTAIVSQEKNSGGRQAYYCGLCNEQYVEYTDEEEKWICCEECETWFHFVCVGVDDSNIPDDYFCKQCSLQK